MENIEQPLWKRIATPLIVYLISHAFSLIILIPAWQGRADEVMANIHVTGTLTQTLMDLLPVALFVYLAMYREWEGGLRRHLIGAGVGFALAVVVVGLKFFMSGADGIVFMRNVQPFAQSLTLESPWNLFGALAALLAYGPGEAVATAYFMLAFDRILKSRDKWLTWGVFIGAILWALPHLLNIPFQGVGLAVANTIKMIIIGLIFGMALRGSKSWLAPVVFWTLTNGTP